MNIFRAKPSKSRRVPSYPVILRSILLPWLINILESSFTSGHWRRIPKTAAIARIPGAVHAKIGSITPTPCRTWGRFEEWG